MCNTAIRLNEIMSERNLRQVDILRLAEPYCRKYNIKLNKSDLSQFVSGKVEPGQWKLTILGLALNVSEAWLMGYDVPKERGGFGALDPVLPANMQGANLDGAKIDEDFLGYMLSNLAHIEQDTAKYIRTRNNILAIAESSGLRKMAVDFIDRLEQNMVGVKASTPKDECQEELSPAFFRLKQGLAPYNLSEADADFLLDVYKAHIRKNSQE